MRVISNTEISTYLLCEKQHEYRFEMDLEPVYSKLNPSLRRGLMGHRVWEVLYLNLQDGKSINEAYRAAQAALEKELDMILESDPDDDKGLEIVNELQLLLKKYCSFYKTEPFRVIAVERVYTTSVDDYIEYGLRLDLLVEMTSGQYYGELMIVDHKFVYNFYTPTELEMNVQMPKYIHTLRENGYPVKGGFFNFIRYRSMKEPKFEDIFKRTYIFPKKEQIQRIWEEQASVARHLGNENNTRHRTLSSLVCKYCPFQVPCYTELLGKDPSSDLKVNFRPSKYGYGQYVNLATGE